MFKISRKPTENIRAVAQLCLLLSVAFAGVQQCALAQPRNLDIIVQRDSLAPPTAAEIRLVWDGGVGLSWDWSIEVNGIEHDSIQGETAASQCDNPKAFINCRSAPFLTMLNFAEIVTIRATVTDSQGQSTSAVRRVRMGTTGSFWIDFVTPARVEPEANDMFTCDSENADDPPWITLSGDDRSFPLIDVFRDARVSLPEGLIAWDITPDPENPAAEILYIIDRINQTDEFDALAFPLQYGSTQVDARVLPEPPIAPLQPGRLYQIRLQGVFPCEFSAATSGSALIQFMFNPPAPGDPVIVQAPTTDLQTDKLDAGRLELLTLQRQIRLRREESSAIACMNRLFEDEVTRVALIIVDNLAGMGDNADLDVNNLDQMVFKVVTNPVVLDSLRAQCGPAEVEMATKVPTVASILQQATIPTLDLEIVSGSGRLTLVDPTSIYEIRTAHATVIATSGTIDIAQTKDAQRSAIGSPDSSLVVTPNNPALPETTVPPGFFVILSDTSISGPTEFAIFADGFE